MGDVPDYATITISVKDVQNPSETLISSYLVGIDWNGGPGATLVNIEASVFLRFK